MGHKSQPAGLDWAWAWGWAMSPTPSTPALNPLLFTKDPLPFPFLPGQGGGEGVTSIQLWVQVPGWASNISPQSVQFSSVK